MATRILRVDLSPDARDFHATATEPGLPMLDRLGANDAIVHRWLGDLVAEPEWGEDESVSFFVRHPERGRLEDIVCCPATKEDLEGPLRADLATLEAGIKQASPESSTERLLHKIIRQAHARLTADLDGGNCACHFFKYRQSKEAWRLVWCWGYQRIDQQPATAVICPNPECRLLFLRRPGTKAFCPACETGGLRTRKRGPARARRLAVLLLLLLLVVAGALLAWAGRPRLVVTPGPWTGPSGSRVQFQATDRRWFVFHRDVTAVVVPQSHDSRVIAFEPHGLAAVAKRTGRTEVSFLLNDRSARVAVEVTSRALPKSITIEPQSAQLAVGSTLRLKVIGHYHSGDRDLTPRVAWEIEDPNVLFLRAARIEGVAKGNTRVTAFCPAGPDEDALTAYADVEVLQAEYQSLELGVNPDPLAVGQSGTIDVVAVDRSGKKYSMIGSSKLRLGVSPAKTAEIHGDHLVGRTAGSAQLTAAVGDLRQTCPLTVKGEHVLPDGTFVVAPTEFRLRTYESFQLDVASTSDEPIEAVSSDPAVVKVKGPTRLTGCGEGTARVTLTQNGITRVVQVHVTPAKIKGIRIVCSEAGR